MPDLSKTFSIHSSSSSLYSLFFLSDLLCRAMRWLDFLARVPITSSFFRGLDGSDISVLSTLWLKFFFWKSLKTWLMLLLRLKLQRWLLIALTSFSLNDIRWHGQLLSSWTLRTFLALYIFFFLFQFFFSCGINRFTEITLLISISSTVIFVVFFFTIFNNFLLILYLLTY